MNLTINQNKFLIKIKRSFLIGSFFLFGAGLYAGVDTRSQMEKKLEEFLIESKVKEALIYLNVQYSLGTKEQQQKIELKILETSKVFARETTLKKYEEIYSSAFVKESRVLELGSLYKEQPSNFIIWKKYIQSLLKKKQCGVAQEYIESASEFFYNLNEYRLISLIVLLCLDQKNLKITQLEDLKKKEKKLKRYRKEIEFLDQSYQILDGNKETLSSQNIDYINAYLKNCELSKNDDIYLCFFKKIFEQHKDQAAQKKGELVK